MSIENEFGQISKILIPADGHLVEQTVARELVGCLEHGIVIQKAGRGFGQDKKGVFSIAVADEQWENRLIKSGVRIPCDGEWVYFRMDKNRGGCLLSSKPYFLYTAFCRFLEQISENSRAGRRGWMKEISFPVEKSTFDLFLTQYARTIREFDREAYIREYARLGFSQVEINALATPFPYEQGVPGEFYPDFYTYCPALDQFVESRLNQGLYPKEYLKANLSLLKENAKLALKYGLVPGLLCFEPRSVPETLFQKYPTLRGARVDHPFRSFKPRYTLSLVHPVAQRHYAELLTNLMKEVPELGFMAVWSNDSGSGFEHTKSLYVGRNGGAYMIREWKTDEDIARAAAGNIACFLKLLKEAGSKVNSQFRVISRLESFYGERRYLWPQLSDGVDVEVNSLLVTGWENNYPHPSYPDIKVLGSAFHNTLWGKERNVDRELRSRGSLSYFYHFINSHGNHEPLLGIPFPWLAWEKLVACRKKGLRTLAHMGGLQPPDKVPYAVNQEVFRAFQFDARMDIDKTVLRIAEGYVGRDQAPDLVRGWRFVERAVRQFVPLSLYSGFGTVWNRLLVRPLVPDIDRIPEEERSYYEKFMVSSVHNPNKVDLAKDVLFELVSKDYARKAYRRIDRYVWKPLDAAVALFKNKTEVAGRRDGGKVFRVFEDQYFRAAALRCLYETLRNTAVWIYAVHEYLDTRDGQKKKACRRLLKDMTEREIRNARASIRLWREAPVEWMIVSGFGETPFIYGENYQELLEKKIALMKKYGGDKPFIDSGYMFRVENNPYRE
jgi:hypothetical protein